MASCNTSMTQDIIDQITSDMPEELEIEVLPVEVEPSKEDIEVIKFSSMQEDLEYSIKKLRNSIDNTTRIMDSLALDMLSAEDEDKTNLTIQYTSLDAAMNKNIELLQKARKDISIVMTNLAKAKADKVEVKSITNNVTIEGGAISTADIIAQLKKS